MYIHIVNTISDACSRRFLKTFIVAGEIAANKPFLQFPQCLQQDQKVTQKANCFLQKVKDLPSKVHQRDQLAYCQKNVK